MQHHLTQAQHNLRLHRTLCEHYPEDFTDWKITLLFYAALHWVRALAWKRKIYIGDSHKEIARSCNPALRGVMPISRKAWGEYQDLMEWSQAARYNGMMDEKEFRDDQRETHGRCIPAINYLQKYMEGRGIGLEGL